MVLRFAIAAAAVGAFAATASAKPVTLSTETNLRAAPGTTSEVVTLMPKGAAIEVGECDAGWCKVTYNGKEGFSIGRNLGETAVAAAPPAVRNSYGAAPAVAATNEATPPAANRSYAADLETQPPPRPARRYVERRYESDEGYVPMDQPAYIVAAPPPPPPVYYTYYPYPRPVYWGWRPYWRRW
jgi:uncharacterized protein YraI